jgi:hypothetical protein
LEFLYVSPSDVFTALVKWHGAMSGVPAVKGITNVCNNRFMREFVYIAKPSDFSAQTGDWFLSLSIGFMPMVSHENMDGFV